MVATYKNYVEFERAICSSLEQITGKIQKKAHVMKYVVSIKTVNKLKNNFKK